MINEVLSRAKHVLKNGQVLEAIQIVEDYWPSESKNRVSKWLNLYFLYLWNGDFDRAKVMFDRVHENDIELFKTIGVNSVLALSEIEQKSIEKDLVEYRREIAQILNELEF